VTLTEVAAEGDGGGGEFLALGPLAGAGDDGVDGEDADTTSMATFMSAVQWPAKPQMK
jgi:hypothetical protein